MIPTSYYPLGEAPNLDIKLLGQPFAESARPLHVHCLAAEPISDCRPYCTLSGAWSQPIDNFKLPAPVSGNKVCQFDMLGELW